MKQAVIVAGWSLRCAARKPIRTVAKILIPPTVLLVLVVLRLTMKSSSGKNTHSNSGKPCIIEMHLLFCRYRLLLYSVEVNLLYQE